MSAFSAPGFLDIQTVFGAPQLTGVVKARSSGVPKRLPSSFYQSRPGDSVIRNTGSFKRKYGTQQGASVVGYGEAAKETQKVASQDVPFICVHTFDKLAIKLTDFNGLIKESSSGAKIEIDEIGIEYIGEQLQEFQTKFDTVRNNCIHLALVQDAVYIAPNGSIPPTSSGAQYTIQSGVLNTHKGQIPEGPGGANILSAGWQNPSTDIPTQIINLFAQAAQDFAGDGPTLEYAFYGANVPKYLFTNTALLNYLRLNETQNLGYIANAKMPEDNSLLRLKWVDCSAMFYRQAASATAFNANALQTNTNTTGIVAPGDGVATQVFGPDTIVFTPDPAKFPWWKLFEGHYPIPGDALASTVDPLRALANAKLLRGLFAYAGVNLNPAGVDIYMGDVFFPAITAPNAIYQCTVNF